MLENGEDERIAGPEASGASVASNDGNGVAGPTVEPVKRKVGRPSNAERAARAAGGDTGGSSGSKDGAASAIPNTPEPPKSRRAARPGASTRAAPEAPETVNVKELATEIAGAYFVVAVVTREPAFDIGMDRALTMASAIGDVSKYYPIKTNGPTMSLVKLAVAVGMVNIPILLTIGAKRRNERAARQPAATPSTPEEIVPGMTPTRQHYKFE